MRITISDFELNIPQDEDSYAMDMKDILASCIYNAERQLKDDITQEIKMAFKKSPKYKAYIEEATAKMEKLLEESDYE